MHFSKLKAGFATGVLLAANPAWAVPDDFKAKADAFLEANYAADGPGVAVIVVDEGKVVYRSGQGMADIAAKRTIAPETVFRIGSITKQFTAAIVLQLADEGNLSLSDPLSKFIPDYPEPGSAATVAQLLNHTSGIKSYTGIPGWMSSEATTSRPYSTPLLIAEFKDLPIDFAVGTAHRYNNSGYVLLGAVIEKVTGKPWHVAVDERIAKPLGLKSIRYGEYETRTPGMAKGYTARDGQVRPAQQVHMSVPHAAGALIGSIDDLAKWSAALHSGKVVSAARYQQMIAPTTLPDGTVENYGFGLAQGKLRGREVIEHGGGIFGFSTASSFIPKEKLFVAVFANSDELAVRPSMALTKLAAMALGDPFPEFTKTALAPDEIEPLLGLYEYEGGSRRFFTADGKLFTRLSGGRDTEVFPAGANRFFYGPGSLSWFEVKRDPAGKHVMSMYQDGADSALASTRIGPVPADPPVVSVERAVLARYVGAYKAAQGIATVLLTEEGELALQLGPGRPMALLAVSATEFRVNGGDARVVFQSASGQISHLLYRQGQRELRADRQRAD